MKAISSALALLTFAGAAGAAITVVGPVTQIDGASVLEVADNHSRSFVRTYDQSHLSVLPGGSVPWVDGFDDSSVTILGGSVSHLRMYDESSVLVQGGDISDLGIYGDSTATIHRVTLSSLRLSTTATVDIFGYDFALRSGRLGGRWSDGTAFDFWLISAQGPLYSGQILYTLPNNLVLHAVPLPAGVWLLMSGAILLANRIRLRRHLHVSGHVESETDLPAHARHPPRPRPSPAG